MHISCAKTKHKYWILMKTCLECLPCLGKNAVDAAKRSTDDLGIQRNIVAESLKLLSTNDLQSPPPYTARQILDIASRHTGAVDLYLKEKRSSNRLAERLLQELHEIPEYNPQCFESRLRLAIAGNILDFGIFADLDIEKALQVVKTAFTKPLDQTAAKRLEAKMSSAKRILYILDNCGEAVFDRVFMEPFREKIILGVRGREVFNDVTVKDLEDCGLSGFTAGVVDNGPKGIPGIMLNEVSNEFKTAFEAADLIIAKGQGNFESMNDYPNPIAFLFLAKCPVVIREIQAELNSIQVRLINF